MKEQSSQAHKAEQALKEEIARLKKENSELKLKILDGVITVCSKCRNVKYSSNQWLSLDRFLEMYANVTCSHGYCDACAEKIMQDVLNEEPEQKK
ncbi:MAG: hypothetical protein LBT62_01410 [Deltaproteobacteria bacterium]|jgi:hypothetical protein|nr:hypothetical protein [Deltaproteobacteria bacterium]